MGRSMAHIACSPTWPGVVVLGAELHQRPHAARGALVQSDWLRKRAVAWALGAAPEGGYARGAWASASKPDELRPATAFPGGGRRSKATALSQFTIHKPGQMCNKEQKPMAVHVARW
jgi:hypothetical protein